MTKRPTIDQARAALIAEQIAGNDEEVDSGTSVYWCETCDKLWYESGEEVEYATWLCWDHWQDRKGEWRNSEAQLDPKIGVLTLWT